MDERAKIKTRHRDRSFNFSAGRFGGELSARPSLLLASTERPKSDWLALPRLDFTRGFRDAHTALKGQEIQCEK